MNVRTVSATLPIATKAAAASRLHAVAVASISSRPLVGGRLACTSVAYTVHHGFGGARSFSTTPSTSLRVTFPPPESPRIKYAGPAWEHPVYSDSRMQEIVVAHREAKDWKERLALRMMRIARYCMDKATGYAPEITPGAATETHKSLLAPKPMDERKWLIRILFLESIAGVPGMVAGMLRHLHSLRRLKRDNGWIESLLEEAYNERMHLLTFMKMAEPGWFMKTMILGAQGVFFNGFFLAYLMSPRTCHRFVGYLEEEAVYTYTRILRELDAGNLPQWTEEKFVIPDIAIRYWNMPEGHRTMRDLLLYVRADEAKHREVNHTLGNLDQMEDPNPFISEYVDPEKPHPTKGVPTDHQLGWERKEVIGKD